MANIQASLAATDDPTSMLRQSVASEKGAVNQLEDMALTQTMFEEGKLIWQGEAEEFVNIIQKSRNSIKNMDTQDVYDYLNNHPDLLESLSDEERVVEPHLVPLEDQSQQAQQENE